MVDQHHHDSRTTASRLTEHEPYWRRFGVHRASEQASLPVISTGWPAIDRQLPGGGYPLGAVTELLTARTGIGEFSLLLPCLAVRLHTRPQGRIALVSPPSRLNAPALSMAGINPGQVPIIRCRDNNERLWCIEQMARSGAFTAFVVWDNDLDHTLLRRLQLAAEQAVCPIFVYRDLAQARQRSPAALRLAITCPEDRQQIDVLKCRGPAGGRLSGLRATRDSAWQMPALAPNDIETHTACNDHVACSAFSPLGAR